MNRLSNISIFALTFLLLGNLLMAGGKAALAQSEGIAITSATTEEGKPACWVAVGNKLFFVAKDETTILKVKASGAL